MYVLTGREMFNQSSVEWIYKDRYLFYKRVLEEIVMEFVKSEISKSIVPEHFPETLDFYSKYDREYRSIMGQFFTPKRIRNIIITFLKGYYEKNSLGINGLEPACGTGELIPCFIENGIEPVKITAIDIEEELISMAKNKNPGVNFVKDDFLLRMETYKFDLIVSNPPYVEVNRVKLSNEYKKLYNLSGRCNLYIPFVMKSIELLNPGGLGILFFLPV